MPGLARENKRDRLKITLLALRWGAATDSEIRLSPQDATTLVAYLRLLERARIRRRLPSLTFPRGR